MHEYPHTVFSTTLVKRVGSIKEVLGEFLDKQIQKIQLGIEAQYDGISGNVIEKLLDEFVTLEGTKRPMSIDQIQNIPLSKEQLEYSLIQIENSRILRFEENQYELTHDTLALSIAERRSNERVQILKIKKIFERYDLKDRSINNILTKKEVRQIENIKDILLIEKVLTQKEWNFVIKSEKTYRRRYNRFIIASISISLILATLLVLAIIYGNRAKKNQIRTQQALIQIQKTNDQLEEALKEKTIAVEGKNEALKTIDKVKAQEDFKRFIAAAESFIDKEDYESAKLQFDLAQNIISSNSTIGVDSQAVISGKARIEQLQKNKKIFDSFIKRGNDAFRSTDEYNKLIALQLYRRAYNFNYKSPRKELVKSLEYQTAYSLPLARERLLEKYKVFREVNDPEADRYLEKANEIMQEMQRLGID